MGIAITVILMCIIIDQTIKIVIKHKLPEKRMTHIGIFKIIPVQHPVNQPLFNAFFVATGMVAFCFIVSQQPGSILGKIMYSMAMGGAVSNYIDTLVKGYTIDYIPIKIIDRIANIADLNIIIGTMGTIAIYILPLLMSYF